MRIPEWRSLPFGQFFQVFSNPKLERSQGDDPKECEAKPCGM